MQATGLRQRISAPERRELIVRAAAGLFAERGYGGARLDDIAAAATVTKPIVYRHFSSKKDLYLALLARHRDDLPRFFAEARAAGARTPEALVETTLDLWLDYVRENSHAWLMLFRDTSGDAEIRDFRAQVNRRAREVVAAFLAEQAEELPAEQLEPAAELLTNGLAGLALWWIDHPQAPKAVVLEVALRFVTAAISPPALSAGS